MNNSVIFVSFSLAIWSTAYGLATLTERLNAPKINSEEILLQNKLDAEMRQCKYLMKKGDVHCHIREIKLKRDVANESL